MTDSIKHNFELYTYFRSSSAARVRIALHYKGIPFTAKYIHLLKNDQSSPEYAALNPSRTVPTLIVTNNDDTTSSSSSPLILTQSISTLEWLEEAYPEHPLLPPRNQINERELVRRLVNIISNDIQPVTNLRILQYVKSIAKDGNLDQNAVSSKWMKEHMHRGLMAYETIITKTAGKYSVGDQFTMADCCLVPAVHGAQRFGVDMSEMKMIMKVMEEAEKVEAVEKGRWDVQEDTPEDLRRKSS